MKKKFIFLIGIILSLLFFIPKIEAMSLEELKEAVESDYVTLDIGYLRNSSNWEYDINVNLRGVISKYDYNYNIKNLTYDRSYVYFDLEKWNDTTNAFESVKVTVPLKISGIYLDEDVFEVSVGDTITIKANKFDENFNRKSVEIENIDTYFDDLIIKGNKVTVTSPGFRKVNVNFKLGEDDYQGIEVILLVDIDEYIENKLFRMTDFKLIRNHDTADFSSKEAAERGIINSILYGEEDLNFYDNYESNSVYNEETNILDIDVTYTIRDKKINIKKDGLLIEESGIVFKNYYDYPMNIEKGESVLLDYTAYSEITWKSTNESVATVNQNGKVTAVGPGGCFIVAFFNGGYERVGIRVKDDLEAFKGDLTDKLNDFVGEDRKIYIPAISNIGDYLYDVIWAYTNKWFREEFNDENLVAHVNIDDDFSGGSISLGYSFYDTLEGHPLDLNGTLVNVDPIPYCVNYNDEYYSENAFNCATDRINIEFVFEDQTEDFDPTLLQKALNLGKNVKSKLYPSYLNGKIEDFIALANDESLSYMDKLIENAHMQDLIKNDDGFELVIDARAGDNEFGRALTFGYCYIERNGIVYTVPSERCGVKQVLRIDTGSSNDKEVIKKTIKNEVTKELSDATVNVDEAESGSEFESSQGQLYNISISLNSTSNEPSNSGNKVRNSFKLDSNNKLNLQTYVEQKGKVSVSPTVKVKNANNNSLLISWNEITNAEKYALYRSTDNKKWEKIYKGTETSYTNTGLTYGKKYYYKVKAYNSKSSKTSSVVSGKTTPNKVTNLTVKSIGSNNVKLTYDKVKVTGYEIYNSTDNKKWTKVATISKNDTLEYNVKKLKENKTYYFKVRAYKTVSGKKIYGKYSEVVSAKTAPKKPEVTLKLVDYNKISFNFTTSKGATYYLAQSDISEKFDSEGVTNYTLTEPTITELTGEVGKTLYVRVKACNKSDKCSGWTTTSLKYTPKAPKLTLSTTSKKVTSTINTVNGAYNYQLYMSTSKKGKYSLLKEFDKSVILTGEDIEELEAALEDAKKPMEYVMKSKKGVTYYFKVRSYTVVNGKKVYSPYSSIKSITSK